MSKNKYDRLCDRIEAAMKDLMDLEHRALLLDCEAAIDSLRDDLRKISAERNEARIIVCTLMPFVEQPKGIDHDVACAFAKSQGWNCMEPWDFPNEQL